jgi:hypothetical protein
MEHRRHDETPSDHQRKKASTFSERLGELRSEGVRLINRSRAKDSGLTKGQIGVLRERIA